MEAGGDVIWKTALGHVMSKLMGSQVAMNPGTTSTTCSRDVLLQNFNDNRKPDNMQTTKQTHNEAGSVTLTSFFLGIQYIRKVHGLL